MLGAAWSRMPDACEQTTSRRYIGWTTLGAVVTSRRRHETSQEGFNAEWRVISFSLSRGDLDQTGCEVYDEA